MAGVQWPDRFVNYFLVWPADPALYSHYVRPLVASQAEAVSGDRPGSGVLPRGGQALALTTLCTVLFLTFLDNTVVSVALGDIQVRPSCSGSSAPTRSPSPASCWPAG